MQPCLLSPLPHPLLREVGWSAETVRPCRWLCAPPAYVLLCSASRLLCLVLAAPALSSLLSSPVPLARPSTIGALPTMLGWLVVCRMMLIRVCVCYTHVHCMCVCVYTQRAQDSVGHMRRSSRLGHGLTVSRLDRLLCRLSCVFVWYPSGSVSWTQPKFMCVLLSPRLRNGGAFAGVAQQVSRAGF